ncbi:MAG TPA: DUF4126 domain-containing protein [Caldilineaceae bacterium]|nr:DUF4126 domain-containing protein [Caldilineaceae bacterium]
MELILSVALGIGLSAACGMRVFAPFAVMSAAALTGQLGLSDSFAWIGSYEALVLFSVATLIEVLSYYIPWVDNLLDTIATPAAVLAGAIATASVVTDMSPLMRWTLAIIAGGGTAGIIQMGTTWLRGVSSVTTGGLGNFVVSTGEWMGSLTVATLSVLFPLLVVIFVIMLLAAIVRRFNRRRTATDLYTPTPL